MGLSNLTPEIQAAIQNSTNFGYSPFTFPQMNTGFDNKDAVYNSLLDPANGVRLPEGITSGGTWSMDNGEAAAGKTFYIPDANYNNIVQPYDTNPEAPSSGLGIIGSVLSLASIAFPPLAPIAAGVNAISSISQGNVAGMLSSALPYIPGMDTLTAGVTGAVKDTLDVSAANAQAITNAGIAGGISGLTGGGLQGALTNAAIAGVGTLAKPSLSTLYSDVTGTPVPSGDTSSFAGLAPNQFYGPDGEIMTDNFSGAAPSISSLYPQQSSLADNQFYGPDGEVLTDSFNPQIPQLADNQFYGPDGEILTDNFSTDGGVGAPVSDATITPVTGGTPATSTLSDLGAIAGGIGSAVTGIGGGGLAKLATGLYGAYNNRKTAEQQNALADKLLDADPYRDYIKTSVVPFMRGQQDLSKRQTDQADEYQGMYKKSYTDPLSIYNSPEMQGLNNIFKQQIDRRDAAAGRNSQYGARNVEMQNNFMANQLPQYRSGLASMYGTTSTNATNSARTAIPPGTGTAGLSQYGAAASGAIDTGANQYTGLLKALGDIYNIK